MLTAILPQPCHSLDPQDRRPEGDGGDIFSSCQGSKVGAVEGKAQIAVGCAEAALLSVWGEGSAYLLAFSVYKGKLQVIILNGFVCPVGG